MKELNAQEIEMVDGGLQASTAIGIAGVWVGGVAAVGLGLVGAPVIAGAAVGMALGGALLTATSLI